MSIYANDSTLYTSATTATETFNKELQLVSEWVARNKLVLNISKTKSSVFGTNHSLNPKPQLHLVMNNVEIEQVEVTTLLGVTMVGKLSWSKHIDTTVAKMGRSLSVIKHCSAFTINKAGPTGPGFVSPGLSFSRVVRCLKEGLGELQLAQNRAAQLALKGTQRANINNMHVNLS